MRRSRARSNTRGAGLHLYDFDGTLFRSPNPHALLQRDWWPGIQSLTPPVLPVHPGQKHWVVPTVRSAKRSIADKNVFAVMMTARPDKPDLRYRIPDLLQQAGLDFDAVHLTGGAGEKARRVIEYLRKYPFITTFVLWDDTMPAARLIQRKVEAATGIRGEIKAVRGGVPLRGSLASWELVPAPRHKKKRPGYTGIFLDAASRAALTTHLPREFDRASRHHVTLALGAPADLAARIGEEVEVVVTGYTISPQRGVEVATVSVPPGLYRGETTPHVTISHREETAPEEANAVLLEAAERGEIQRVPPLKLRGVIDTYPHTLTLVPPVARLNRGIRGGYSPAERAALSDRAFLVPETRSWPVGDYRHAQIALNYMARGFGNRSSYPMLLERLFALYPPEQYPELAAKAARLSKKHPSMTSDAYMPRRQLARANNPAVMAAVTMLLPYVLGAAKKKLQKYKEAVAAKDVETQMRLIRKFSPVPLRVAMMNKDFAEAVRVKVNEALDLGAGEAALEVAAVAGAAAVARRNPSQSEPGIYFLYTPPGAVLAGSMVEKHFRAETPDGFNTYGQVIYRLDWPKSASQAANFIQRSFGGHAPEDHIIYAVREDGKQFELGLDELMSLRLKTLRGGKQSMKARKNSGSPSGLRLQFSSLPGPGPAEKKLTRAGFTDLRYMGIWRDGPEGPVLRFTGWNRLGAPCRVYVGQLPPDRRQKGTDGLAFRVVTKKGARANPQQTGSRPAKSYHVYPRPSIFDPIARAEVLGEVLVAEGYAQAVQVRMSDERDPDTGFKTVVLSLVGMPRRRVDPDVSNHSRILRYIKDNLGHPVGSYAAVICEFLALAFPPEVQKPAKSNPTRKKRAARKKRPAVTRRSEVHRQHIEKAPKAGPQGSRKGKKGYQRKPKHPQE